jgi:hypothetical protein
MKRLSLRRKRLPIPLAVEQLPDRSAPTSFGVYGQAAVAPLAVAALDSPAQTAAPSYLALDDSAMSLSLWASSVPSQEPAGATPAETIAVTPDQPAPPPVADPVSFDQFTAIVSVFSPDGPALAGGGTPGGEFSLTAPSGGQAGLLAPEGPGIVSSSGLGAPPVTDPAAGPLGTSPSELSPSGSASAAPAESSPASLDLSVATPTVAPQSISIRVGSSRPVKPNRAAHLPRLEKSSRVDLGVRQDNSSPVVQTHLN